jgi:cytoskeletal protein CcmA (bactofilin family)
VVDGKVTGNIIAEKVHLTAQAQVKGQLQCQGIMIDNGAYIDAKFSKGA